MQRVNNGSILYFQSFLYSSGKTELAKQVANYLHKDMKKVKFTLFFLIYKMS